MIPITILVRGSVIFAWRCQKHPVSFKCYCEHYNGLYVGSGDRGENWRLRRKEERCGKGHHAGDRPSHLKGR